MSDPTSAQPRLSIWPGGPFYRPELDALRFAAFLLVYEAHTLPLPRNPGPVLGAIRTSGALGVQLFFVLSAYLITELLMREKSRTGTVDLKAFYIRRILRIWPLYFAALFACFGLSRLLPATPMPLSALLAYLLLVGNFWSVWNGFLPLGLGALWTICLEEQFYLIWPSLVRLTSRRTLWIATISLFVLAQVCFFLLLRFAFQQPVRAGTLWFNSLTHLQYFVFGSALSLALRGRLPPLTPGMRLLLAPAGLFLLFLANYRFHLADPRTVLSVYLAYLITGLGVCMMLLAVLGVNLSSRWKPAVWFGKVSYGLYVFHLPMLGILAYLAHDRMHLQHSTPFAALPRPAPDRRHRIPLLPLPRNALPPHQGTLYHRQVPVCLAAFLVEPLNALARAARWSPEQWFLHRACVRLPVDARMKPWVPPDNGKTAN